MNMAEKNGQPSMEEILASIRRIIAEEPMNQAYGDFRGSQPIVLKGDGVLDDAGDFDLPSIFRSSSLPAPDRPAPLLGRLTDAIRNATTAPADGASDAEDAASGSGLEAEGAKPDARPPYQGQGLSSLQPMRTELPRTGDATPMNGSAYINGHAHRAETSAHKPESSSESVGAGGEPQRVMAAFKDTHFLKMSAPASVAAPAPAAAPASVLWGSEPATAASDVVPSASLAEIAPVVAVEPQVAIPPVAEYVMEVVEDAPAPQTMMAPPPPLPESQPADLAPEGVGSIEDTTADLLRPMLRQWLADNMPRMVEKALHIEIAESVKPPKKP